MTPEPPTFRRYRLRTEIISHPVRLYNLFNFSLPDVELILAQRGIAVTYESIRHWCAKPGAEVESRLRRRRPKSGDTWYMDDVFIRVHGKLHYLWRAVDQQGVVLEILVQTHRNARAAKRLFWRLLIGLRDKPRASLPTDYTVTALRTRPAAGREESAEPPPQPPCRKLASTNSTTRTTDATAQITTPRAKRFLSVHAVIYGHFPSRRHLMSATGYRRASHQGVSDLATGDVHPSASMTLDDFPRYRLAQLDVR